MNKGKQLKTINSIMTKKMNDWLSTIEDTSLRNDMKADLVVTGGSIASMLTGEEVKDYDVYFRSKETLLRVVHHYVKQFEKNRVVHKDSVQVSMNVETLMDSHGEERVRIVVRSSGLAADEGDSSYQYFESREDGAAGEYLDSTNFAEGEVDEEVRPSKPPYAPVYLSSNAITLKNEVQIIVRFFGDPEEIHKNFDFVHCTNYWTYKMGCVVNQEALLSLMSKTLVYRGSRYPVCSLFRVKKFVQRGFHINAGQILKMAMQISDLDLNNFDILEEQLTGVDVAFFQEVLNKLSDKSGKGTVDTAYLMELINRMFD